MKKNLLAICVAATIALPAWLHGVENPNVGGTFSGPSSTVPSANQSRRMITPSDPTAGNNIVTGNVSGMKYFRGVVPYGSSYYSGANASDSGTQAVENFLRRSSDPILSDRSPGTARPYYQPDKLTTRFTRPETLGMELSGPVAAGRATSPFILSNSPILSSSQYRQRPLSNDSRQIEELLTRQNLLLQEEAARLQPELLKEKLPGEKPELLPPSVLQQELINQPAEEEIEQKLRPEEEVQAEFEKENQEAILEQESMRSQRQPFMTEEMEQKRDEEQPGERVGPAQEEKSQLESLLPTPQEQADTAAVGREIIAEYKSYDSLADARYTGYMQNAEQFIKEGKFYKAADLYELASIWRPREARGYLGKGFSLFAAGEYMSSSYYVGRAIELEPTLAARSFKLDKLIGDRDVFENRLLEMAQWQEKSKSGELAFLIAYVLYHDGKTAEAAAAIAKAEKAMPDSASVQAMKNVIAPSAEQATPTTGQTIQTAPAQITPAAPQ